MVLEGLLRINFSILLRLVAWTWWHLDLTRFKMFQNDSNIFWLLTFHQVKNWNRGREQPTSQPVAHGGVQPAVRFGRGPGAVPGGLQRVRAAQRRLRTPSAVPTQRPGKDMRGRRRNVFRTLGTITSRIGMQAGRSLKLLTSYRTFSWKTNSVFNCL